MTTPYHWNEPHISELEKFHEDCKKAYDSGLIYWEQEQRKLDGIKDGVITVVTQDKEGTRKLLAYLEDTYPSIEFQVSWEEAPMIFYRVHRFRG